jgi:hypothetical protein
MNQIPICSSRIVRGDRISLRLKKLTALRGSSSPAIKDRKGAVEGVLNSVGSKLASPAEDNPHQTLDPKEIVRAITITGNIKKTVGKGMMMMVNGICSNRMTEAERDSISIKIMEVSSTIMKVRTIKEVLHRRITTTTAGISNRLGNTDRRINGTGTITTSNTEMRALDLTINTIKSKTPTMMRQEEEVTVTQIEGIRTKEGRYLNLIRDSREARIITSNS